MNRLLPVIGILAATTLLTINLVNTASAQTISEFTLLLRNLHFKNQGQCISQFPQIIFNAHIAPDLSLEQIKEIVKPLCKQGLPT